MNFPVNAPTGKDVIVSEPDQYIYLIGSADKPPSVLASSLDEKRFISLPNGQIEPRSTLAHGSDFSESLETQFNTNLKRPSPRGNFGDWETDSIIVRGLGEDLFLLWRSGATTTITDY